MIPGPESIPEPELHTFSEIDDSDSNSDSRKKWNHNTYRGVMIPWLESIPESEPNMGMIPIPVPIPRKNGIITPLDPIETREWLDVNLVKTQRRDGEVNYIRPPRLAHATSFLPNA